MGPVCRHAPAPFLSAAQTFVASNTIVAWHAMEWNDRLLKVNCAVWDAKAWLSLAPAEAAQIKDLQQWCKHAAYYDNFFRMRKIDDGFTRYPQTSYRGMRFNLLLKEIGDKQSIFWMWNPKNHKDYFNINITYASYPESQDEANAIAGSMRLPIRLIYDPAD